MNSALINVISRAKQPKEHIIDDPIEAERAVKQVWGV